MKKLHHALPSLATGSAICSLLLFTTLPLGCSSNSDNSDGEDGDGGDGGGSGGNGGGGDGGDGGGGDGGGGGKGGTGGTGGSPGSGGTAGGMAGSGGAGGAGGGAGGTGGGAAVAHTYCPSGMQWPEPDLAGKTPMVLKETGFSGVEGPVWVAAQNAFFFSDLQRTNNQDWSKDASTKIWKYTPANNMFAVFIAESGSNGLALTLDGKILAATHSNGGLTVFDPADATKKTVLLDKVNGMRLGSPNDLAVRADGNIYFSDPEWQKPNGVAGQGQKVYRVDPAKNVTVVSSSISRPNGVTLSPDGNSLYVTDDQKNVWKFKVAANGTTTADGKLGMTQGNYPDGMTADCAGNVYVATSAGIEVFKPNGTKAGTIAVTGGTLNVAFGGSDMKTLFITGPTNTKVSSLQMNLPGLPY